MDLLWTVAAVVFGVLFVLSTIGGGWLLFEKPDWPTFVDVPAWVLFWYWMTLGAWLRTRRGRQLLERQVG